MMKIVYIIVYALTGLTLVAFALVDAIRQMIRKARLDEATMSLHTSKCRWMYGASTILDPECSQCRRILKLKGTQKG